jgi:hypothetical protein
MKIKLCKTHLISLFVYLCGRTAAVSGTNNYRHTKLPMIDR